MSDRPKFFDDLAGVAGGAISALAGLREEAEAMVRAPAPTRAIRRLDLVKRERIGSGGRTGGQRPCRPGGGRGEAGGGDGQTRRIGSAAGRTPGCNGRAAAAARAAQLGDDAGG